VTAGRGPGGDVAWEIASGVLCLGPWGRTQTNVYLVRSDAGWTLVDAGWERDATRIEATVAAVLGRAHHPGAIALTHCHPDHAGAAPALARAWGCPVLVHPLEIPIAHGDVEAMTRWAGPLDRWVVLPVLRAMGPRRRTAVLERSSLRGVAEALDPAAPVPGMDGWRCVLTPGHTPGHTSFQRLDDGVLISGDALVTLQVNSWAGMLLGRQGLTGPPWYTTWDRRMADASLRTIAERRPYVLAPGHGQPLRGSTTAAAIERAVDRWEHGRSTE
jgi:glyoxylase-like metal-dependent hydrolase (beta-lactamase superfamily II)